MHKRQNNEDHIRLSCNVLTFVSLLVLGKLGTRQDFQKVSGREIAQSTEVTQNDDTCMKDRILMYVSVRPAHNQFCVSYVTRQIRH
jgi:hypothetical protein